LPHSCESLLTPLSQLSFIGPKRLTLFSRLVGQRLIDLLWHLPQDILLRRAVQHLCEGEPGETVTLAATIVGHTPNKRRGQRYTIQCFDGKSYFDLVYFHGSAYLSRMFPLNSQKAMSGKIEQFLGKLEIVHPDYVGSLHQKSQWEGVQPVYPLTAGITQKFLRETLHQVLYTVSPMVDWLTDELRDVHKWPAWHEAIRQVHQPQQNQALSLEDPARQRLAFDELLANQLSLQLARRQGRALISHPLVGDGRLQQAILASLPFELTAGQQDSLTELETDMAQPLQMLRLLQGDVGSGKTIVALLAAARAMEAGFQVALLAPTDILARQHLQTLQRLGKLANLEIAILTGREKGRKRQELLAKVAAGDIHLLIGTHALIEPDVIFQRLGLVIIDEQHRFGVEQRLQLVHKGQNPHLLAMTATPIPRTMRSVLYGDLDVSVLPEKPKGRIEPQTKVLPEERLPDVIGALERALANQVKVYWVCPLVEDSEKLDLTAALDRFASLQKIFGDRVGLIHGKMSGKEKDQAMHDFAEGAVDILVATTVIEVGVDVPSANIMVIENAQRFGLSQLHQLRGRIGRGQNQALPICLLLYQNPLSSIARQRLEIMRISHDGFFIAEEDLKLRGGGEFLGTQQSGAPRFRFIDWSTQGERAGELLAQANHYAREICQIDPQLLSPQGQRLRFLLRLFEKDKALSYMRSA
jgi:ATP-dependent DNA helicase RecG